MASGQVGRSGGFTYWGITTPPISSTIRTTTHSSLVFCPFCGNKTLAKVVVTIGINGTLNYNYLGKKQFSHRGLRVSGRDEANHISGEVFP